MNPLSVFGWGKKLYTELPPPYKRKAKKSVWRWLKKKLSRQR